MGNAEGRTATRVTLIDGQMVGFRVDVCTGNSDGRTVCKSIELGADDGWSDGFALCSVVGSLEGCAEGCSEIDGTFDGTMGDLETGWRDGGSDGLLDVGDSVDNSLRKSVGLADNAIEGDTDGSIDIDTLGSILA